jgi:hypothetical protein
VQYLIR